MNQLREGSESRQRGPITGESFQEWSQSLQEIEDMVFDEGLRNQAGQINDQARQLRTDFRRHGKEPQWDILQDTLLNPMVQLQQRIEEALALRLREKTEMIPVDRDPVPSEFSRFVDQYYQRLSEVRTGSE